MIIKIIYNRNAIFLITLLILVYSLISCRKTLIEPIEESSEYFPNSIGDRYTYKIIYDSVNEKYPKNSYNLNIKIIGSTSLPDGTPVKIWVFNSPYYSDTNYVFSNNDSVIFYDKSIKKVATNTDHYYNYVTNNFYFPLELSSQWVRSYKIGRFKVIDHNPVTIGIGTFNNAYLIHEHGNSFNYVIDKDQWFTENIGIVKISISETYFGSAISQTWELINYNIH